MGTVSHKEAYCISLIYLVLGVWLLASLLARDEPWSGEKVTKFNDNGWKNVEECDGDSSVFKWP